MAAKAPISVEDYLHASFAGPDREYVDGEVVERNVGENLHARTQWRLAGIFFRFSEKLPLYGRTEMRVRVSETRFRIPDLAVYAGEEPTERVPSSPPLVAIEILSPDDRMSDMLEKLDEYRVWGVPHIWLVHPEARRLYTYRGAQLSVVEELELPEFEVRIGAAEVF